MREKRSFYEEKEYIVICNVSRGCVKDLKKGEWS